MKRSSLTVFIIIFSSLICGCIQLGTTPNSITGHVYMDGHAISGAHVEAISVNGTGSVNTTTDNNGAYTLNINPKTTYSLTATWQGLMHTVYPVYLPGDTNTYDINLTSVPSSTIEGSGYELGGPQGATGPKRVSGLKIGAISVNGSTYIIAYTDSNGDYKLNVEPNVLYNISLAYSNTGFSDNGIIFNYRNEGPPMIRNVTVSPNETVLIDYMIPVP